MGTAYDASETLATVAEAFATADAAEEEYTAAAEAFAAASEAREAATVAEVAAAEVGHLPLHLRQWSIAANTHMNI